MNLDRHWVCGSVVETLPQYVQWAAPLGFRSNRARALPTRVFIKGVMDYERINVKIAQQINRTTGTLNKTFERRECGDDGGGRHSNFL